jgi:L-lactate permease
LGAALAGAVTVFGGLYLVVDPVVGALGGWLTGSNAHFMPLQLEEEKSSALRFRRFGSRSRF